MLTAPAPPELSYYSDQLVGHQPGKGLVWRSVVVIILTVFPFLDACRKGTVGFPFYDDRMYRNSKVLWCLLTQMFAWPSMKSGCLGSLRLII